SATDLAPLVGNDGSIVVRGIETVERNRLTFNRRAVGTDGNVGTPDQKRDFAVDANDTPHGRDEKVAVMLEIRGKPNDVPEGRVDRLPNNEATIDIVASMAVSRDAQPRSHRIVKRIAGCSFVVAGD